MDVTRTRKKRDKNNFIQVILSKIELAQNFHQRIALSITSKSILNHVTLKFYLRKRYNNLYLYVRALDNFGSITARHQMYLDFKTIIPEIELESTKGHYTGLILQLTVETRPSLIRFLKLIAILASPKDFYVKKLKATRSFMNYTETSQTPIHFNISELKLLDLKCYDIYKTLEDIKPKCQK